MELLNLIERACEGGCPGYRDVATGVFIPSFTGAKGGGATTIEAPQISPEEAEQRKVQTDLTRKQVALAEQQAAEYEQLKPILYEDYGLTIDPTSGKVTRKDDPARTQAKEILNLQNERSLKALRGELNVSPTLEREIAGGKNALAERMSRQLGTGWETSTPGIQAMNDFDAQAEALREGERRDQMTTAEALALSREGQMQGILSSRGPALEAPRDALGAAYMRASGASEGVASNYSNDRNLALRVSERNAASQDAANARSAQASAGLTQGAFGLGSSIVMGAALA